MTHERTALVTGAASGIGLAVARRLTREGIATIVLDRSETVLDIAAGLATPETPARAEIVDVADPGALQRCLGTLLTDHDVIDIVVNNAGIHPKNNGGKYLVEEIDLDQWNQVLAVNLTAAFLICNALLPPMKRAGWGRVVNIGSAGARNRPLAPSAHYAASKAAIAGLTRCIAEEGAASGTTANCVAPGPVRTGLTASSSPEAIAALTRSVPLGRYGEPDEIAATVAFLVSDEAAFITGATLDINGGSVMR